MMVDCIDLRPWAKTNRYRWRFEESYGGEKPEHRGDGRWFVEVVCQRGLIYPVGGNDFAAYTDSLKAWRELLAVEGISKRQEASGEWRCRFPLAQLDTVAKILRPKRLRGSAKLTPEQLSNLREGREIAKAALNNGQKTAQSPTLDVAVRG